MASKMAEKEKAVIGLGLAGLAGLSAWVLIRSKKPKLSPADIQLSDLLIEPSEIHTGESVSISVFTTNIGGITGSYEVVCQINGKINKKTVTLSPGEGKQAIFKFTPTESGTYGVLVDNLTGSFKVLPSLLPYKLTDIYVPTAVQINTPALINVLVMNTTKQVGSCFVTCKVNGWEKTEKVEFRLTGAPPPNDIELGRYINFTFTPTEQKTYQVLLNGLKAGSIAVFSGDPRNALILKACRLATPIVIEGQICGIDIDYDILWPLSWGTIYAMTPDCPGTLEECTWARVPVNKTLGSHTTSIRWTAPSTMGHPQVYMPLQVYIVWQTEPPQPEMEFMTWMLCGSIIVVAKYTTIDALW